MKVREAISTTKRKRVLYQAASLESIKDPKCSEENFAPRLLHERVFVVS